LFFFSSRRRHTRSLRDWSSDVCSSDLDMWQMVRRLRESGVTIILTTHYIEEAEEMADRIGVINKGELVVVEDKSLLMRKLGKKRSEERRVGKECRSRGGRGE